MYDGLRNFFVECVLADHNAYREARSIKIAGLSMDLRLAVHACSSMFHLADHVFDEFKNTNSTFPFKSLKGSYPYNIPMGVGVLYGSILKKICI